eukprot:scaffold10996_cov90-Isochrysis_galbana.AAC.3
MIDKRLPNLEASDTDLQSGGEPGTAEVTGLPHPGIQGGRGGAGEAGDKGMQGGGRGAANLCIGTGRRARSTGSSCRVPATRGTGGGGE